MLKRDTIEKIAIDAANSVRDNNDDQHRDIACWNMYHSNIDTNDKNYLNKFGNYYLPAKVPFNTITRDNIDWIVSRYISRPFIFSVKAVDDYSIKQKYRKKLEQYFKVVDNRIKAYMDKIRDARLRIEMERNQIQKILQQQPENEEQQAMLQQLEAQMPVINAQFEKAMYFIEREAKFTEKDKEQVDIMFKYSYEDIVEIKSKKALLSLKDKLDIEGENEKSFLEYNVTNNPYIFVDYDENKKKYVYKHVPGYAVKVLGRDDSDYTDQATAAVITQKRSLSNVLRDYGEFLNETEIRSLHAGYHVSGQSYIPYHDHVDNSYRFKDPNNYDNRYIDVKRVFIMVNEGIEFIESPNKYNPELKHYKRKKEKDNVRSYQKVVKKYVNKTYEAVVIADKYVVDAKPRTTQDKAIRKFDNPSYAELPLIGFNFNGLDRTKYSLIWATKDLQSLYNIINYYEEYMLATSGIKTLLMDKSQIPEGMDPKEWMYEKKLGVAWVETVKKSLGLQGRKSNFNNWTMFDESISPSIQYLEMMKQNIKVTVDQLSGVSRQARGQMTQYDGAKTSELAVESSSIITDIHYWRHDKLVRKALTRLIRLYGNISGKKENFVQYLDDEGNLDNDFIPKDVLTKADLDVLVTNNNEEMRKMKNLEQLSIQSMQKGTMQINELAKVLNSKTVNEMDKKLDVFVERALALHQQNQQAAMSVEKEKEQLKTDLDKYLGDQKAEIEKYKLQLDEARMGLDEQLKVAELQIDKEKNESDTFAKIFDTVTERETEMAYLDEQKRSTMINEILQATNTIIDSALNYEAGERNERMNKEKVSAVKEKANAVKQRTQSSNRDNRTSTKKHAKEHIKD
jgi:hypothetical protein